MLMADSKSVPAWQTPLQDLHLARVMFRDLRAKIIAWQKEEYDTETLKFLADRQDNGLPFSLNFSGNPDAIKQIKNFINALYLAERAFEKCGNLNLTTAKTYDPKLIAEAYEACHLLLNLSAEVETNFSHEIAYFTSNLSSLLGTINNPSAPTKSYFVTEEFGYTVGQAIAQMKPSNGGSSFDLLTYFGAVFPSFPTHLANIDVAIKKQCSKNPEHVPNINQEKMKQLLAQGIKLNDTIAHSSKNTLYFVFNLLSLINQTRLLWSDIIGEAGDLDETLQALGREFLALLKYDLLPTLLQGVDKLELQLMLKPGRLSMPLMEQIKPWHEILIQTLKPYIKFNKKNEQLLKLEDSRFIALRTAPLQQVIETSAQALHFIGPAQSCLDQYTDILRDIAQDTKKDKNKTKYLLEAHTIRKAVLKKEIKRIKPYMSDTDKKFIQQVEKHLDANANWRDYLSDQASNWYYFLTSSEKKATNNPTHENIQQTFKQLKLRWEQLKTNHNFKIKRHEAQIQFVQEKSHRVVFPYNPNNHYQNPIDESSHASWTLYRTYEQQITQLKQAQTDCDNLKKALDANPLWFKTKRISFHPKYTPALLTQNTIHQSQNIYFKIEGAILKYEVLEPFKHKLRTIYVMPLHEAIKAGHRGYVWNHEQNQLSYIAEDGQVQVNITLSNSSFLKLFLKGQKSKLGINNELELTEKTLHRCIILRSQKIHKGSIPLVELGCSLTQLTMPEQLTPYLAHIFNEALERGHIHDELKANCIKWYSSIQPYLMRALNAEQLDEQVAHVFSGSFNKKSSSAELNILPSDMNNKLVRLKVELEEQMRQAEKKRDTYFNKIKNEPFVYQAELKPQFKHREFSLDTAQFMQRLDPIKLQIHVSKNTLFKLDLALTHLKKYKPQDNPQTRLDKDDYPWFQAYSNRISSITISEMQTQLEQMRAYEAQQISRNERILDVLNTTSVQVTKKHAFMHFGHTYEPALMLEGAKPKPGELQLKIENGQLRYKLLHYNQILSGTIPLDKIEPSLSEFDENTIVSNETLSSILNQVYTHRNHQIDAKKAIASPEEALDLYQWYRVEYDNLSGQTTEYAERLKQKIDLYEALAKEKPELNLTKQEDAVPEDRTHYLLKHKRISNQLKQLKTSLYEHFEKLNTPLQKALQANPNSHDLPYPEVGAQNWLINILKQGISLNPIMHIEALRLYIMADTPDPTKILTNAHQVLLLKRLMNIIYYLEQIVLELEKINESDGEISYVMHLVISYLYVQDIMPLLEGVSKDPIFSRLYASVNNKIEHIVKQLSHESNYYIETNTSHNTSENINTTLISILNTLKMLPERLSSSTSKFKEKRHLLKKDVQTSVNTIEKVLEHYNSSWSYLLLFMDLPAIKHLLSDMGQDLQALLKKTHGITMDNLTKIKTDYLAKIMLEADALEHKLGLVPGLLSKPLEAILEAFYKGFITPLVPEIDKQIKLLCEGELINKRLNHAQTHKVAAHNTLIQHLNASKEIDILLDACEEQIEQTCTLLWMQKSDPREQSKQILKSLKVDYLRYQDKIFFINHHQELLLLSKQESELIIYSMKETEKKNNYTFKPLKLALNPEHSLQQPAYNHLNAIYQEKLPVLKAALNSSDVYLMPFQEAKKQGLRDCFVWDEKKSQLYHLDSNSQPNPQTGCKLFLMSIPADQEKPDVLVRQTTQPFPFNSKYSIPNLTIETKHPTLVQHGKKYYMYANADNSGWKYTALDAEVVANMGLDFSQTRLLDVHKKYQDMYHEIAVKTGLVYPIQLTNMFKTLRFITQKKAKTDTKIYLSEHAISEYITSNSDFSLPQQGVCITPGCCLVDLKSIPTDYYELELPAGYSSYYAQAQGQTDTLYYIDTETRSITTLPIPEDKQADAIRILNDTKKHRIFDTNDFDNIHALTQHTSNTSIMVDVNNFKPDTQSIHKMHALVKACKAYYKGMSATSKLAWKAANEQVASLTKSKDAQANKYHQIKTDVYTKHLTQHVRTLVKKNIALQSYKLYPLQKHKNLKPNCLYIKKISSDVFEYRVINPAGKPRGTHVNMKEIVGWPKGQPLTSIDELTAYLPAVLRVTSKRGDGHTHSYTFINEYQEKLTQTLLSETGSLVEKAITAGNSKTIDDALALQHEAFNQEYLKHYQQLDAINRSVSEFRHYLKRTENQSKKSSSFFEKKNTIELKREMLDIIDTLSSDSNKEPQERVKNIQKYLKEPDVVNNFMAYHQYESTCFESLLQCVFGLLEASGLYTPKMAVHLDNLVDEVVKKNNASPPKPTYSFRFFAKTTRESIKDKIDKLKPDEPAP